VRNPDDDHATRVRESFTGSSDAADDVLAD
jgi:hypothetical protein